MGKMIKMELTKEKNLENYLALACNPKETYLAHNLQLAEDYIDGLLEFNEEPVLRLMRELAEYAPRVSRAGRMVKGLSVLYSHHLPEQTADRAASRIMAEIPGLGKVALPRGYHGHQEQKTND